MSPSPLRTYRVPVAVLATALLFALMVEGAASRARTPIVAGSRTLVAVPLRVPPGVGPWPSLIEQAWEAAPELDLPLRAGRTDGTTLDVRLRAVYTPSTLYLWLRWPDDLANTASLGAQQQRATVTWKQAAAIGGCAVACHASFSQGRQIDSLQLVAPDVSADLPAPLVGAWSDGAWTLGYGRPLVTANPVDVQFINLHDTYHFGLDVDDGRLSSHTSGEELTLRFQPA